MIPVKQYTQQNIRFVTMSLGISTEHLAAMANIDLTALRLFQTNGFTLGRDPVVMDELIKLCNYFTIHLGDLLYTDIETADFIDKTILVKLKAEMTGGAPYDREPFITSFMEAFEKEEYDSELEEVKYESITDGLKNCFYRLHTMFFVMQEPIAN